VSLILLLDSVSELLNLIVDIPLFAHEFLDLCGGVHHGRVISSTKLIPNLRQGELRQLTGQIHRYLPRIDD